MARKPPDQLSAAYRRRIERAEARGVSRQAARGHKPREHVARAAWERAEGGGLTRRERQSIRDFYDAGGFSKRRVGVDDLYQLAETQGYGAFSAYRRGFRRAVRERAKRGHSSKENQGYIAMLEAVEEPYEYPTEIFFYH